MPTADAFTVIALMFCIPSIPASFTVVRRRLPAAYTLLMVILQVLTSTIEGISTGFALCSQIPFPALLRFLKLMSTPMVVNIL